MPSSLVRTATRQFFRSPRNLSLTAQHSGSSSAISSSSTSYSTDYTAAYRELLTPQNRLRPPTHLPFRFKNSPSLHSFFQLLIRKLWSDEDMEEIWSQYLALTKSSAHDLPLVYHREALRRCVPLSTTLQKTSTFAKSTSPHAYEGRLQTVMRNISSVAEHPILSDYLFILEQFSAVGHYLGARAVYKEILLQGLKPNASAFFFVLQAIAHRVTLPGTIQHRDRMKTVAKEMLEEAMDDMARYKVPFTSALADVCARLAKETGTFEGFEDLLRKAYGIDMSNPDHLPLPAGTLNSDAKVQRFFHLSTTGLNTILMMYGKEGNTSKLVQAFEVLTAPLPEQAKNTSFDDDDDDFGVIDPDFHPPTTLTPPSAAPNVNSLAIMLRHMSAAREHNLGRHYFLHALHLDKIQAETTRAALSVDPFARIPLPSVAVNRHIISPMASLGRRSHNIPLMKRLLSHIPPLLARKKDDHEFYKALVERRAGLKNPNPDADLEAMRRSWRDPETRNVHIIRPFDIHLHMSILWRDIRDITRLEGAIELYMYRLMDLTKDRMGRRIWRGQDVWIGRQRGFFSKDDWKKRANYRPLPPKAQEFAQQRELKRQEAASREESRLRTRRKMSRVNQLESS